MKTIIYWFNSLGWIANIITISTPLSIFILKKPRVWLAKKFKKKKVLMQYHCIYEFIQKEAYSQKGSVNPKDLKILILDDELEHYPIDYLKDSNYNIECKQKISLSKIDSLLKYNIIILDITGIVEEDLNKGGFELLKRLKERKPYGQAIIAASSKLFDMSVADFYKLADKKIKTPIDPIEIEAVFNEVVKLKFSINDIAKSLDELIQKEVDKNIKEEILSFSILFLQGEYSASEFKLKISPYLHGAILDEFIFNINSLIIQINDEQDN